MRPRVIPLIRQTILTIIAISGAVTLWKETEDLGGAQLFKVPITEQTLCFSMHNLIDSGRYFCANGEAVELLLHYG